MAKKRSTKKYYKKKNTNYTLAFIMILILLAIVFFSKHYFDNNILGEKTSLPDPVFRKTEDSLIDETLYILLQNSMEETNIVLHDGGYGDVGGEFKAARDLLKK